MALTEHLPFLSASRQTRKIVAMRFSIAHLCLFSYLHRVVMAQVPLGVAYYVYFAMFSVQFREYEFVRFLKSRLISTTGGVRGQILV